jgi:hypothetical protein
MKPPDPTDDRLTDMLTRALAEEAAHVDPDPGALQVIQGRLRPAPRRNWWVVGTWGAGLATAAVITAVVIVTGPGSGANTAPPAGRTQVTPPNHPNSPGPTVTTAPSQPPSTTSNPPIAMHPGAFDPAADTDVTMYYLGPAGAGFAGAPRLYTEPHTVSTGGALAAVHEFLTSTPIDPDYVSGWPQGVDVSGISTTGDVTTIALYGDIPLADLEGQQSGSPALDAKTAIQALARTAGIRVGAQVAFTYNGTPMSTLFQREVPRAVDSDLDVLALIQITSPVDGQTLASPVTVTGVANVFEGTVNWELFDSTGARLQRGIATASQGQWTSFTIELGTLPPGRYTIRCLEYSAADGSPIHVDDKVFTVQ